METTMSGLLNNTTTKSEAHQPDTLDHHTLANNLNIKHEQNKAPLYCFFTRAGRTENVSTKKTEQNNQGKSPIPTRVTINEVYSQENVIRNKDKNLLLTSEKPLAIIDKINIALSKLYRFAK